MKMKILMIGPGRQVVGGITGLVENSLPLLKTKLDLLYVDSVKDRNVNESGKISLQNIIFALSQYIRFLINIFVFRPQVIHVHTSQGLGLLKDLVYVVLAHFFKIPIMMHVHAADTREFYEKFAPMIKTLIKMTLRSADMIIAVSEEWRARLQRITGHPRVVALRNCVDVSTYLCLKGYITLKGITAIFLGTIGPRKGAFDLLDAIGSPILKESSMEYFIAGYEERKGLMKHAIEKCKELKLNDRCHLTGTVLGVEKLKLLQRGDVFVLPSYNEGLPMSILEAMASGLAIISTAVGGIPEAVKNGYNGFVIEPGDIQTLADKLWFFERNPQVCRLMGKNSRSIAQNEFDIKAYVERLVSLYRSVIRGTVYQQSLLSQC